MKPLERRVGELEQRSGGDGRPSRWVRIWVNVGETSDVAKSAYEAEHGPLADDIGIILRAFATPEDRENEK